MADLLTSKRFWLAIFALVIILIGSKIPGFAFDAEIASGYIIVIASYALGLAVDPGLGDNKWSTLFRSRKFWAAAVGFVVLILNSFGVLVPFGITQDQIIALMMVVGSYIASVAFEKKPVEPIE
jgi:uncharacterized membrane protein